MIRDDIIAATTAQRRTQVADRIARGGSWLLALSAGVAAGLAQYASLAVRDSEPYDRVALALFGGGGALALASWLWWCVARFRLWRAGWSPDASPERGIHPFLSLFCWLAVAIGGMIATAMSGDINSEALPVILVFGAGCASVVGGLLGVCRSFGRWFGLELREDRQLRAEVRAAVLAQGREAPPARHGRLVLGVVGLLVAGPALIGVGDIGGWLAAGVSLPIPAAQALVLFAGIALCFPSLLAVIVVQLGNSTVADPESIRAYGYRAAAAATAGLAALGLVRSLGLGLLAVPVIIGLAVLAGSLRRRYLGV